MSEKRSWRRTLSRVAPTLLAIVGSSLAFSSFLYPSYGYGAIASITLGLAAVVGGIWFAAHPYLSEDRHHPRLRRAVDEFIAQVRELRLAIRSGAEGADIERLAAQLHVAAEKVVVEAKEDAEADEAGEGDVAGETAVMRSAGEGRS